MSPLAPPGWPTRYQIYLVGQLPKYREAWFDGLAISYDECGNTLLTGLVTDAAALYGLIDQLRDLGLTLISLNPVMEA